MCLLSRVRVLDLGRCLAYVHVIKSRGSAYIVTSHGSVRPFEHIHVVSQMCRWHIFRWHLKRCHPRLARTNPEGAVGDPQQHRADFTCIVEECYGRPQES